METLLQNIINALQWGSFYALIALGYSLVYGVLLLINFAHGDVFMVGAYIAFFAATWFLGSSQALVLTPGNYYTLAAIAAAIVTIAADAVLERLSDGQSPKSRMAKCAVVLAVSFGVFLYLLGPGSTGLHLSPGLTFALAIPACMVLTAAVGVTLERVAYKPLRRKGANRLYVVITALMCGLILEHGNLALFGAARKKFPDLLEKTVYTVGSVSVTNLKFMVIFAALAVFLLLQFVVTRTKMGMAMRASSWDKFAIPLMGIPLDTVIIFTFVLGSGMAGLAGMLFAMSYPVLDAYMGALVGWKAFISAVVGGIGDIRGAFVGGFILGFIEILVAAFLPSSYRDLFAFSILLVIMAMKPTGLFGMARTTKI